MKDALLYQLRHSEDKYRHFAGMLEETMAGVGTRDSELCLRVVQYHWDRSLTDNVKGAYMQWYRKDLGKRIKGETSGDFERLLLACIRE